MSLFALSFLPFAIVITAVLVITARNPIVSVLFLIAVFIEGACFLVCQGVTYLGLTYLVVYVGAVAVLFLFVVMMLNVRQSEVVTTGIEYTAGVPLGVILAVMFMLEALSIAPSITGVAFSSLVQLYNSVHGLLFNVDVSPLMTTSDVHLVFASQVSDASFAYQSQLQALGLSLYTYGFVWLIILSFILLLAMLGPIYLCRR